MFHIVTYLKMRKSGWKWNTVSGPVSFEFPRIWFVAHIVFARQKTIFNTYGPISLPSLGEIKMTSESNRLPKMLFYLFVCRPALICNVCIVEYDHENLYDQYLCILDVRFDLSNYTDGWERRPSAFILCMKNTANRKAEKPLQILQYPTVLYSWQFPSVRRGVASKDIRV